MRRDEVTISSSAPAHQPGGEKSDEDYWTVGDVEGGTTDTPGHVSRSVKPDVSVTMASYKNILLHINGEDSPIISG